MTVPDEHHMVSPKRSGQPRLLAAVFIMWEPNTSLFSTLSLIHLCGRNRKGTTPNICMYSRFYSEVLGNSGVF